MLRLSDQSECFDSVEAFPPIPLTYNPTLAKSDLRKAYVLERTLTKLCLDASAICITESECLSLRLRAGMTLLPDEILEIILEYAVILPFKEDSSESAHVARVISAAISLTSVCKRFRDLGVRIPRLWNRISNVSGLDAVSECCERARNSNVEIIFQSIGNHRATGVAPFLEATRASSERWSRFVHERKERYSHEFRDELDDMAHRTHLLQAPLLSELAIYYPAIPVDTPQDSNDAFHYYSSWTAPTLKIFTIYYIVPVPFSGSSTLTSFSIYLSFRAHYLRPNLSSLVEFLTVSPNLISFSLTMRSLKDVGDFLTEKSKVFGGVKNLKVVLIGCEESPLRSFFDRVLFPNVDSIELGLTSRNQNEIEGGFHTIFHDPERFLNLKTLVLDLDSPDDSNFYINISFSAFTNIRNLTLTLHRFGICAESAIPDGPCLPSLRRLSFKDCSHLERSFVAQLLRRLKAQGNLPRLSVNNCRWFDWDEVSSEDGKSDIIRIFRGASSSSRMLNLVTAEAMLKTIEQGGAKARFKWPRGHNYSVEDWLSNISAEVQELPDPVL
ncbi:hypothetical protein SCHPADRAFT_475098 [Schizopora paradoxa]|uniref:Uncharacterized protein n=1 Tax=Schizopora paradoxa TaxID=27342 RepID=A0A0H2S2X6_9AGAM|nr:hypothetical protein SCHPADRAFT_475098 [Schizopora paradoxa]